MLYSSFCRTSVNIWVNGLSLAINIRYESEDVRFEKMLGKMQYLRLNANIDPIRAVVADCSQSQSHSEPCSENYLPRDGLLSIYTVTCLSLQLLQFCVTLLFACLDQFSLHAFIDVLIPIWLYRTLEFEENIHLLNKMLPTHTSTFQTFCIYFQEKI